MKVESIIKNFNKGLMILVAIIALSVVLFLLIAVFINYRYEGLFYKGVYVAGIDLSGKSIEEAKSIVKKKINKMLEYGISLKFKDKEVRTPLTIIPVSGVDVARDLVVYDIDKTLDRAYVQGRHYPNVLLNFLEQYNLYKNHINIPFYITLRHKDFEDIIKNSFEDLVISAKSAQLFMRKNKLFVSEDKEGEEMNIEYVISEVINRLKFLNKRPVLIPVVKTKPAITKNFLEENLAKIDKFMQIAPFNLVYNRKYWRIDKKHLLSLLSLKKENDKLLIDFDKNKLLELFKKIDSEIRIEPIDAQWKITDQGKVKGFQLEKEGKEVDFPFMLSTFYVNLVKKKQKNIEIKTRVLEPKVKLADLNDLGIVELLAVGETSFVGSPKNRKHNIAIGAASLDGIIIKPGEIFSTIKALGDIDEKNGYKPELVIKGDKTIPEFGGGLCQVSTTLFRAVLNAGLPIIQRRNHSYRVSYYEPPIGMDATIYSPQPDFKFKNDTNKAILLKSYVQNDRIKFEIYGEKDNRKVQISKPKVYNIIDPPEPRYIETTDLDPGQKKCIEQAHKGADAEFSYTVIYPSGEKKIEIFKSHYKPWREVCLVGKETESNDDLNKN